MQLEAKTRKLSSEEGLKILMGITEGLNPDLPAGPPKYEIRTGEMGIMMIYNLEEREAEPFAQWLRRILLKVEI
jgi:hypothetical protein